MFPSQVSRLVFAFLALCLVSSSSFAADYFTRYSETGSFGGARVGDDIVTIHYTATATGLADGTYRLLTPGESTLDGRIFTVVGGVITSGNATWTYTFSTPTTVYYDDYVNPPPITHGYDRVLNPNTLIKSGSWGHTADFNRTHAETPIGDNPISVNVTVPLGDDAPPVTPVAVEVRISVKSTCPEPPALTMRVGALTFSVDVPSGTVETPSAVSSLYHEFVYSDGVMPGFDTKWSIETASGAIIDQGTLADNSGVSSTVIHVGHKTNNLEPLVITCEPSAPAAETTSGTDGTTAMTTTEVKKEVTTSDGGGRPTTTPGEVVTTKTTTTKQGAASAPGEAPPPPQTTTRQDTMYSGTGNPSSDDMKKQDFYDAVKQAIIDANETSGPSAEGPGGGGPTAPGDSAALGDLGPDEGKPEGFEKVDDLKTKWGEVNDGLTGPDGMLAKSQEKVAALGGLIPGMPTVPSQSLTLEFLAPGPFGNHPFVVNFTPYADVISNFRAVCTLCFSVLFFYACTRYLRASVADLGR